MAIKIDYEKCCWKNGACQSCGCGGLPAQAGNKVCNGCVEACSQGAITREDIVKIDADKCIDCGLCIGACSHGAMSMA